MAVSGLHTFELIASTDEAVSDTYGRKKVLLMTMLGNILSAAIWLRSTTFVCQPHRPALGDVADKQSSYLLSRVVGGLSEGNVQLSTAIISDVTDSVTRPRSLALVGIAFSVCFTLGYYLFPCLSFLARES